MENIVKIEDYLIQGAGGQVAKGRKSPLAGILVLVGGLAVFVLSLKVKLPDSLGMAMLTLGAIAALTGLFMTILTAGSCKYVSQQTGSCLKHYRRYINAADRQILCGCVNSGNLDNLCLVRCENSTSVLLQAYVSADGDCAFMQVEEYVPHDFVPVTEVLDVNPGQIERLTDWLAK